MTPRLFLLVGVLVAVVGWYVAQRVLQPVGPAEVSGSQAPGSVAAGGDAAGVEDLQLEALAQGGDGDGIPDRNPFRFERRRTAEPAPAVVAPAPSTQFTAPASPRVPGVPQGPPPIPLRYIGFFDEAGDKPRIAVLSDGRGSVFNGREGDIIDGRYRLERIGTESAELAYLDGRGRQTLRLSGQ